MANTGFADYLKQIWKFLGIFLNYIGQIFQKIKIHFQSPKLKLEDNGKQPFRRPFSEIPGPKGLPLVGNILEFNKAGGAEKFNHFAEKLHKEYGDIFKVQLGPQNLVFISNPNFYKEATRQESSSPKTYKLAQTSLFSTTVYKKPRGLFFTDGEKWHEGKALLTKLLLKDTGFMESMFEPYEIAVLETFKEWAQKAKTKNGIIDTHEVDCYKIFMKGMSSFCLGKNYKLFMKEANVDLDVMAKKAIELNIYTEQLNKTPAASAKLLGLKCWKKFEEITLLNLTSGHKVTDIALNALKSAKHGGTLEEFGLIHRFKNICNATDEEIKTHCTDFLFDVSEPVSISLMWTLQALGRWPEIQEKVYQEILQVTGESVSYKDLENMPYLKAVQKEISRIYPTAPFLARNVEQEMIIGGYEIPPKTCLTFSTIVSHNNPEYFPNPDKLWPERWFESEDDSDRLVGVTDKQAFQPFGMGKRACAGKLPATAMIQLFIALLVQNFVVESEEVEKIMRCVLYPDRELKIRVVPRPKHFLFKSI